MKYTYLIRKHIFKYVKTFKNETLAVNKNIKLLYA